MLVKWSPFRELERSCGEFFGAEPFRRPSWDMRPAWDELEAPAAWRPAVNVFEDDAALHIEAQLPGIDRKDVHLSVTDHTLEMRGERRLEREDKKEGYHFREARYGTFARSFTLPTYVDPEKAKAQYDRGVLTITIPKQEQAKPRVIPIEGK